jgi:hypothetical protein
MGPLKVPRADELMAAGLILLVLGVFLITRTVTTDSNGHNLAYLLQHL